MNNIAGRPSYLILLNKPVSILLVELLCLFMKLCFTRGKPRAK